MRSNTYRKAQVELEILTKTHTDPENRPVIEEFKNEILELVDKFGKSGQSGGSAPFVAGAICHALKKLLLQDPICSITGIEEEWVNVADKGSGIPRFQNSRCSAMFKDNRNGKSYYLDAIVWKGDRPHDTFCGRVYLDDKKWELIGSRQYVRFPFTPKTFYIDVVRVPISKEDAESRGLHYIENTADDCYYSVVKDKKQLKKVWEYYDKYKW